jgi:hypothetical protein
MVLRTVQQSSFPMDVFSPGHPVELRCSYVCLLDFSVCMSNRLSNLICPQQNIWPSQIICNASLAHHSYEQLHLGTGWGQSPESPLIPPFLAP